MLPDAQITGRLIDPFNSDLLNPASYDVTLDSWIRVPRTDIDEIDVAEVQPYTDLVEIDENGYRLEPGAFILASTVETIAVSRHLIARLEGKSSLGRLGLAVHITAGFIDPGFQGKVTLEIANLLGIAVRIRRGMRIGQMAFQRMDAMPNRSYDTTGHYQGQNMVTESRYRMPVVVQ